jgi:8-oxo-dGTP pyrophosphatase MutT (NUDIX family)
VVCVAKGNAIAAAVLASAGNPGSSSGGPAVTGGLSPLVASYTQSYSVNRPYSPLPRPIPTFLEGAFGPGSPIVAMPIDPPREDTGRPDVRRFQYQVNYNFPVGTPGSEGYKLAPFAVLRDLADRYSVARSCVDKRKAEIIGLSWDVVATPEAEHAMVDDDKARADWEQRRAKVVDFFSRPDSDRAKYPTFSAWLSGLLEDRFVIDAVAVHLVPPRKKGAGPFGSDIASLDLIDGSTIRPMLNTLGATPRPPAVGYQAYEWGVPRADLMSVVNGDDAAQLGEPVADFRADQLIYMRESPRAFTPYGYSAVEKGLTPIKVGLARQQYQADFFDQGTVPAIFVVPGPDVSTPQQIRQLQDALNSLGQGIPEKHRVIVLPPGSKTEPQRQASLADQFDEWIVSQVAMPFGLTPMDLGVTPRVSAVQSPGESRELSNINTDKGSQTRIEPVCNDLKSVIFDFVIQDLFGQQDMEWSWGLTDRGKNRAAKIQEHIDLIQNGLESIDEGRTDLGKTPWGLPETSSPLVWTGTGPVPLQAIAMDGTQPAAVPGQPAQAALPAGQAQQVSDDELTTPAHEAAEDLPETSASTGDEGDGAAAAAKAARQAAELEYLARHLRKGRTVAAFRFDHLPPAAAEAAQAARPQGVKAAVDAARQAARAQRPEHWPAASARGQAELRAAAARLGAAAGEAAQVARLLTADREGPRAPHAAAKASGDDDEDAHAGWPGWQRDLQLAGIYAEQLRAGLTAAVDTRKLAAQWLAQHPQDSASKAAGDSAAAAGAAAAAAAAAFIARARQAVQGALRRVLPAAWTEGWALGQQSARASAQAARAGSPQAARAALAGVDWANWEPGDPEAAARVAGPGLQQLLQDQDVRIKSIAATRLGELGDVLAEHLSSPETGGPVTYSVDSLAARLKNVLDNPDRAQMVAQTEIARAVSAAAEDTYRDMGVDKVRLSTAGDDRVCPACIEIAARGAIPVGEVSLPIHPLDRCAWVAALPALKGTAVKVGPHGYEHNWVFVGIPGVGDEVHHPVHGKGTVSEVTGGHVAVRFHSGAEHSFARAAKEPGKPGGFARRPAASFPEHALAARQIAGDVRMEHGLTRGQREETEIRLLSAARNLDAGDHEEAARDLDDARHAASGAGGLVIGGSVAARARALAAQVRAAGAAPATKAAGDVTAGAPAASPERVHAQLAVNYRPEGIAWVRGLAWRGPVPVPLDRVDWDHLQAWAAAHDSAHVARFKAEIEAGNPPDPAVMVQVPGDPLLKVIDGHHRSLAYRELGLPVPAWVGLADSDAPTAPWFQAHLYQLHAGADPVNKALGDEDPSRVAFLLTRAVTPDGKWRYLLHKRADDGSWGLPGGTCHDGEVPWDAAVREATEELGDLPPVTPSAVWTRAEDGYVVWTYLVELSDLFAPSADGETASETAGWGWFRKRDVPDLDLHPAMRETWEALDFGKPLLGGKPVEAPASNTAGGYLPQVTVAAQVFPAVSKESRGYDLRPLSGMISLDVPDGLVEPVPGAVDDHHITVAYLGKGLTDEALAEACGRAAAAAALVPGPLNGVISGRGTFPPSESSDGKLVVWAGITLPGAEVLREALEDLSASQFTQWSPHITRAYVDEGDELPDPVPATPVTFTHLSVHRSDGKLSRFALGGSDAPGEPHQGDKDTCPCGTPVEYDEANGWQHADGSVSHDDGESVSDKMAGADVFKMDEGEAGDVRARHLIRWYEEGADGQIHWGEHGPAGDYYQCLAVAGRHMDPDKAEGFCANRHHSVTGQWPGKHAEKQAGTGDPPCESLGGVVKRGLVPGQARDESGHFGGVGEPGKHVGGKGHSEPGGTHSGGSAAGGKDGGSGSKEPGKGSAAPASFKPLKLDEASAKKWLAANHAKLNPEQDRSVAGYTG